jgi:hypothetical protein
VESTIGVVGEENLSIITVFEGPTLRVDFMQ